VSRCRAASSRRRFRITETARAAAEWGATSWTGDGGEIASVWTARKAATAMTRRRTSGAASRGEPGGKPGSGERSEDRGPGGDGPTAGSVLRSAELAGQLVAQSVAEHPVLLDVLVVHLGGTRVAGLLVTMDGKQGADLVELFGPQSVIPVHYDDYTVFRSPLSEFTQHAA
jgi:hypothetical protein